MMRLLECIDRAKRGSGIPPRSLQTRVGASPTVGRAVRMNLEFRLDLYQSGSVVAGKRLAYAVWRFGQNNGLVRHTERECAKRHVLGAGIDE